MKGIILKSIAVAPLIVGVPKSIFLVLLLVLTSSLVFEIPIIGLILIVFGYVTALRLVAKDPYFDVAIQKAVFDSQPLANKHRQTGYLKRYYNA